MPTAHPCWQEYTGRRNPQQTIVSRLKNGLDWLAIAKPIACEEATKHDDHKCHIIPGRAEPWATSPALDTTSPKYSDDSTLLADERRLAWPATSLEPELPCDNM